MSDNFIIKERQEEMEALNFITQDHMLFATPFWQTKVEGVDNKVIKDYCYAVAKNKEGVVISNRGGFHSKDLITPIPKELDHLVNQIHSYINGYCSQITNITDLGLGNLWININPPGTYNRRHDHQKAVLSAVYYVDAEGPSIGDFMIERDDNMEFFAGKYRNSPTMRLCHPITPLTGFLFVLPAWVYHSVESNLESHDRISIAINFVDPSLSISNYGE